MELRLFALRGSATGRLIPGLYFGSKSAARAARNARNAGQPDACRVTCGPDHKRYRPGGGR